MTTIDSKRPKPRRLSVYPKIATWDALAALREHWRRAGKVVVWTNGCFDLIHRGHVRNLQTARSQGDVLVVGVNSDASIRCLKGSGRPIVPAEERAEILAALECVNHVVVFDELTPEASIARLKPDICCKGSDYAPPHGKPAPEKALVESYGGRMAFIPLVGSDSTTNLIRRIRAVEEAAGQRSALFLDRDGTVIEDAGYPRDPRQVRLLDKVGETLAVLKRQGFQIVLVSNQSGIGRGLVTAPEAEAVHQQVVACLGEYGVTFDAAFYCPHAPEESCRCRKPSSVMILDAARELGVDLAQSFMIGDKPSDVEAGQRAGCRTILFAPPGVTRGLEGCPRPDHQAASWPEILLHVLSHSEKKA